MWNREACCVLRICKHPSMAFNLGYSLVFFYFLILSFVYLFFHYDLVYLFFLIFIHLFYLVFCFSFLFVLYFFLYFVLFFFDLVFSFFHFSNLINRMLFFKFIQI